MTNQDLSALCMHYILRTDDTSGLALEALYLEWLNDYLTVDKMAEHMGNNNPNGLMVDLLAYALELGKEYNNRERG